MTPKQQATALAESLALAALAGTMHDFHKREALRYVWQKTYNICSNQLRKDIILIAGAVILNGVLLSMF